ncbi:hypothetical protein MLD38_021146 [Melastoma candidum]|uniref:Uncharacterized protein n=1 Tax=Melastoma candidum TaxID=119954 RepID=A0ACB9QF22_9MYRT|nr:hypothetical protein MLD38_021146 [Melastoma candidum]
MATRRCLHALHRHAAAGAGLPSLRRHFGAVASIRVRSIIRPVIEQEKLFCHRDLWLLSYCRFCSVKTPEDDDMEDEDEEEGGECDVDKVSDGEMAAGSRPHKREYTPEEKEAEASEIGYKVIEPLGRSDRVFKSYEPVFAVVQIGSHQFKFCYSGSPTQTIVGRPIVPEASVHTVVEEHALDAKVIIFKKRRRKNYRRTKGHRQELTKLRITDIQGIEKPEIPFAKEKPAKVAVKLEKVAVAA